MAVIKSSSEHLTLNADGASKDIKFQANGVEKASISSAGVMTATSFAGDGSALTGMAAGSAAFASSMRWNSWDTYLDGETIPFSNVSANDCHDDGSNFNTTTNSYVVPATGVYAFWASIYTANADSSNGFAFYVDGTINNYMYVTDMYMYQEGHSYDNIMNMAVHLKVSAGQSITCRSVATSDVYSAASAFGGYRLS